MRIVTAQELESWLASGRVLEKDAKGVKVVSLVDGRLLKIFRSRRNPLLARLRPDARRFFERARHLRSLGIDTPRINDCCWLDKKRGVSACFYHPLAGEPLDRLFHESREDFFSLLPELAAYILMLHRSGIYFRSLHLGNILRTPDGGFGLIDFLDIRFKQRPLSRRLVQRNFAHLRSYLIRRKVAAFPWEELLACYEQASRSSS
ncbi:toluene tolerance protein [Stutzerimonas kunmingensis]|jgi:RIO-like serine/threonine protein kinase|uniref:toluene tolerance protein n=1 Tax=Stutzerimonas stutzeri subgroup TaxID=578833 RepID=UPI00241EBFFF|nr:toluene tolerance protein [Stutzerimonas kunmingensis]